MACFQILVILKAAVALQEPKSLEFIEFEITDAQFLRIAERPPKPLAGLRMHQQTIRVVHFRAPVLCQAGSLLAKKKHARQRCDAELPHGFA